MSQNDTECTQCKLQYSPVEGNFRCRVCPPGSERPNQNYTSCVCKLLYQPVILNNNLVSCIRCPAGSSKRSQDDLHCTCDLRFYPVMQDDELLECRPCPVGSSRLNHGVSECTCQLQLYPVYSSDNGMLQECHPCPTNSARMNPSDLMCTCSGNAATANGNKRTITETEICNVCPLEYTVVANNTRGLYLCEPCRPPGSRRLSHADENCVCGLEYYPVMQNGALQACNRCPPGSSRLSLNDTECTCNPDYYDNSLVHNGLVVGLRCQRCPAGSLRNQNAIDCNCQPDLLSNGNDNFSLRCLHCPMYSEKKTADDRECTCLGNNVTRNGNTTTTLEACIPPMPTHATIIISSEPATSRSRGQGLVKTVIAVTPCVVVAMFVIACVLKYKRNNKPKAFMEAVNLEFHPVDVSRSLAVSESIITELCNLEFEEKETQTVNRGSCTADVRERDQEISKNSLPCVLDSEMRLVNKPVSQIDASEDYGSVEKKPVEIGCFESNVQAYNEHASGPNYDSSQRYELVGSAYDQTQRYELAGSAYDQTQRYELAGSAYDQTQRYELAGSAYDQTQRYELAGSAYDQLQSYEQLGSDHNQIQGYEQPNTSPSDHTRTDSDAADCSSASTSLAGEGYSDIDANDDAYGKVISKEQTESEQASSRDAYEIISAYDQVQSYQQAHSAYDVIQDYIQVP